MGDVLTLDLEHKAARVRQFLAAAVREHARVVYANSLGSEAMVLTDIICLASAGDRDLQHRHRTPARADPRPPRAP